MKINIGDTGGKLADVINERIAVVSDIRANDIADNVPFVYRGNVMIKRNGIVRALRKETDVLSGMALTAPDGFTFYHSTLKKQLWWWQDGWWDALGIKRAAFNILYAETILDYETELLGD